MTTPLTASWSLVIPNEEGESTLASRHPSKGEETIDVKQGDLVELNGGIQKMRDHLNDLLTHWKDVVGDEGQSKLTNLIKTEQQDENVDEEDESSEGENGMD